MPNPGRRNAELLGVTVVAADDAWAVGWPEGPDGFDRTLIEHWNGSSWTIVPSPKPGLEQRLNAVSATSSTDAWAVGWYSDGSSHHPLIEHWDGSRWSQVRSFLRDRTIELTSVAAVSAADAWAVGFTGEPEGTGQAFVEHWDGSSWKEVGGPRTDYTLHGIAAGAPDDVWMVGEQSPEETLIERWDGTSLTVVPSSGRGNDHLEAVDVPSGEAWAVGWYYSDTGKRFTETLHFVSC